MPATRFTSHDADAQGNLLIFDILEIGHAETRAQTRRRLMKVFGRLLDEQLDGRNAQITIMPTEA